MRLRNGSHSVLKLKMLTKSSSSVSTTECLTKKLGARTGLPVAGKCQKDHLTQSETLSAGQLLKAVEMKEDTSILVHIQRLYVSGYRQYTRFLTKSTATVTGTSEEQSVIIFHYQIIISNSFHLLHILKVKP
ncbi:DASH complex subunit DUO1 [Labeo rohita]|uniref:DASH complex subunit DUO1 n=1 Tax=Labeo rohita TaxID=84645 RepID=A0ABQ8LAC0_LABRO|nr:DASH complex subunit DUO1 [Labeo rohita]